MAAKHRNLFRESLETDARKRAEAGLAALTHREWMHYFNDKRPTIGGRRVKKIGESTVSRAFSNTPGIARRHGADRAWVLQLLGIDYAKYIAAWGNGPAGDAGTVDRRGKKGHRTDSGNPPVE